MKRFALAGFAAMAVLLAGGSVARASGPQTFWTLSTGQLPKPSPTPTGLPASIYFSYPPYYRYPPICRGPLYGYDGRGRCRPIRRPVRPIRRPVRPLGTHPSPPRRPPFALTLPGRGGYTEGSFAAAGGSFLLGDSE